MVLLAALVAGTTWTACGALKTRTPIPETQTQAASFSLPAHTGDTVSLASLLSDGPAVLVFYRGDW
ncbi:MAG: hypothetical protein ACI9MR_004927 [Myxococcota bacterium]|jgi:hypothetical protein